MGRQRAETSGSSPLREVTNAYAPARYGARRGAYQSRASRTTSSRLRKRLLLLIDRLELLRAPALDVLVRPLGPEQDPDQPLGAVEAAPEVVLLAAGAVEERAEVALVDACQLGLALLA